MDGAERGGVGVILAFLLSRRYGQIWLYSWDELVQLHGWMPTRLQLSCWINNCNTEYLCRGEVVWWWGSSMFELHSGILREHDGIDDLHLYRGMSGYVEN